MFYHLSYTHSSLPFVCYKYESSSLLHEFIRMKSSSSSAAQSSETSQVGGGWVLSLSIHPSSPGFLLQFLRTRTTIPRLPSEPMCSFHQHRLLLSHQTLPSVALPPGNFLCLFQVSLCSPGRPGTLIHLPQFTKCHHAQLSSGFLLMLFIFSSGNAPTLRLHWSSSLFLFLICFSPSPVSKNSAYIFLRSKHFCYYELSSDPRIQFVSKSHLFHVCENSRAGIWLSGGMGAWHVQSPEF